MSESSSSTSIYGGVKKYRSEDLDESSFEDDKVEVPHPPTPGQMREDGKSTSYININHFFRHVFSMPVDRQADLLNTMQYSLIALIPLVVLNKLIQRYIPEANETKSSMEIILEVILQLVSMIVGMFFIDRFATFFTPYSKFSYPPHSIFYFMLGFLLIVLTIQTKLGEKISILYERAVRLYYGNVLGYKNMDKKKDKNASSSPKLDGMQILPHPQMIAKEGMSDSTSIHQLPVMNQSLAQSGQQTMYSETSPNAAQIRGSTMMNDGSSFEPLPADSVLGGGGFGSSW